MTTASEITTEVIFSPEPHTWGLRGDAELWRVLRNRFRGEPLPDSSADLLRALGDAFTEITGTTLADAQGTLWVESLRSDHGGMSDGGVTPELWRNSLIPLLRRNWTYRNFQRIALRAVGKR